MLFDNLAQRPISEKLLIAIKEKIAMADRSSTTIVIKNSPVSLSIK